MKLTGPPDTICHAKRLRREMSLREILLWRELRQRPGGLKFRHQHPARYFVLDFYSDAARLAVEVDGEAHERGNRPARDERRDVWLAEQGARTLRIPATTILNDLGAVIRHIIHVAQTPSTVPADRGAGPLPPMGEE